MKVAVCSRELTVEAARQCAKDRKEWRALGHIWMIEFNSAIFAWPWMRSFGMPSRAPVDYHLERGGMPLHDAVCVNSEKV